MYMSNADFDSILAIAAEREGIKVFLSSTPTGARKRFWQACTDPSMHFKEFHFPSTCNPNWGPDMEEEFRSQLSEQGYIHEVMADFGSQETGVFDKDKIDAAMNFMRYAYSPLTYSQQIKVENNGWNVEMYIPPENMSIGVYKPNKLRTMGIDWDKYGASSSIIILDYVPRFGRFMVVRRIEVPKAEYSFDKAVNMIIDLNRIYKPSYIYADRGSGEYQIEMLHKYGDQHPESGLKLKVKGFQFSQKIPVIDPVTHITEQKPMKPFMVNQLSMCIERNQLIMSPFDETLHKQLVDYEVVRVGANGNPVYTSENEHFVDALGLAFLAFALEMPNVARTIEEVDFTAHMVTGESPFVKAEENIVAKNWRGAANPWSGLQNGSISYRDAQDKSDGDQPKFFKAPMVASTGIRRGGSWGSRRGSGFGGRSMF